MGKRTLKWSTTLKTTWIETIGHMNFAIAMVALVNISVSGIGQPDPLNGSDNKDDNTSNYTVDPQRGSK